METHWINYTFCSYFLFIIVVYKSPVVSNLLYLPYTPRKTEWPVYKHTFTFYDVGSSQESSHGVEKCVQFSKELALCFTPGIEKYKSYLQKVCEYLSSIDVFFSEAYFKFRSEKLV